MVTLVSGLVALEFVIAVLGYAVFGVGTVWFVPMLALTLAVTVSEYVSCAKAVRNMSSVATWGVTATRNDRDYWLILSALHVFLIYLCLA